ncbi:S8 family serine peptidase [Paenibacillus filicis]|uniref:S8 family serine peptidase n=1 Tax=Paenibacillus filicis TaxID=669464 RepID=A0ABU9DIH3_9BACL
MRSFLKKVKVPIMVFLSLSLLSGQVLAAANISGLGNAQSLGNNGFDVFKSVYETTATGNVYKPAKIGSVKRYLIRTKNTKEVVEKINLRKSALRMPEGNVKSVQGRDSTILIADLTESEMQEMYTNNSVVSIELDSSVNIVQEWSTSSVHESVYRMKEASQSITWGSHATGSYMASQQGIDGNGIKVAVLDTGVSIHEDLNIQGGISFVQGNFDQDEHGHGTHIAGTIAALDNEIGIQGGAPGVDLYSVKVLDEHGNGSYSHIIQGIDWAIQNKMNIISMSFTGKTDSQALHEAIQNAASKGIMVIAAAGNEGIGTDTIQYPARYPEVISVGSVDRNYQLSSFSSTGPSLDLVAPGSLIVSTTLGNKYSSASGTSMAAASVAAGAALVWSQNKDWDNNQVKKRLIDTTTVLGDVYGKGLLNTAKALGIIDGAIAPMYLDAGVVKFELPPGRGEGDVHVSSFDKEGDGGQVKAGDSITVSLKLDGDQNNQNPHQRIEISVYPKDSANIVDSKIIYNPSLNTKISYTWQTNELTPTGTYVIRYHYPAYPNNNYDDYFTVYVTQKTNSPDTYEPNDTFISAYTVNTGQTYTSYLSTASDIDYYRLKASSTGALEIVLDVPATKDYDLYVFDSTQNMIGSSKNSSGVKEQLTINVETGATYYILISGFSGAFSATPYYLTLGNIVQVKPTKPTGLKVEATDLKLRLIWNPVSEAKSFLLQLDGKPIGTTTQNYYDFTNLTPLTSYTLGVASENVNGTSEYATIVSKTKPEFLQLDTPKDMSKSGGSYQLFAFKPDLTGYYKFFTSPHNGGNTINDTAIELYSDESLTARIGYNDDANGSLFSELKQVLLAGETYYVKVYGMNNKALLARIKVVTESSSIPFLQEDTPVDISGKESAVYQFIPLSSKSYIMNTGFLGGYASNGFNDTQLEVFSDPKLTQRLPGGFNDDFGGTVFSQLKLNLNKGTTYYVKVSGFQGRSLKTRLKASADRQNEFIPLANKVPVNVSAPGGGKSYYTFTPNQSGLYRFLTIPSAVNGFMNDTELSLYADPELTSRLAVNNDVVGAKPYGALFSKIEHNLNAGTTYYVVVRDANGYAGLNSRLMVEDSFYSSRAAAIPVVWNQVMGNSNGFTRDVSSLYDTDYYRLEITESAQLRVNITANSAVLEDSNGNFKGIFSANKPGTVPVSPGTYYIKVQYYPNSNDPTYKYNPRTFKVYEYEIEFSKGNVTYSKGKKSAQNRDFTNSAVIKQYLLNASNLIDFVSAGPYEYHTAYDRSIVEVYSNYNNQLIFRDTIGRREADTQYYYDWYGTVNRNTQYGTYYELENPEVFGEIIQGYHARDGLYYMVIYPDHPIGKKYPRYLMNIMVMNNDISLGRVVPPPPMQFNGIPITAKNKNDCGDVCLDYFIQYVLNFNGGSGAPQYEEWLEKMYGPNGLQKFWHSMDNLLYDENKSDIENYHDMLDNFGLIPVIGGPADAVNGIAYLIEGNWTDAGLSALSIVPVLGEAVGGGKKIFKGVRFFEPLTIAKPCSCFAAGTLIQTDHGMKPIEEIKVGDKVLSQHPETRQQEYKEVEDTYVNEMTELLRLHIGQELISTSPYHPIWIENKGWVTSSDLQVGDRVLLKDGSTASIDEIEHVYEKVLVYNFTVQDFHTYFIADSGIWVHNTICISLGSYLRESLQRTKAPKKGSSNSKILADELEGAGLTPDRSTIVEWDAHHLIPATAKRAKNARDILILGFKIDLNSVANGMWLPKQKGVAKLELIDWDQVKIKLSTHNGGHTHNYYDYVSKKIEDAYNLYGPGPGGANLDEKELVKKGVEVLNEIRTALSNGTLTIGIDK